MKRTTKIVYATIAVLALTCFAPLPRVQAVSPPPDGGYPGSNTAEGTDALFSLTSGDNNTAIGFDALYSDTIGRGNTATGLNALYSNTTGSYNTANGDGALYSNTIGSFNTGVGQNALNHTSGGSNTAIGFDALDYNTTGTYNTASGAFALYNNNANNNTATGANALYSNTTGFYNMANGASAMLLNTTGSYNVAEGLNALYSNTTGNNNIAIGLGGGGDLTTGSYNIDIGNRGVAGESRTIRIGTQGTQTKTYIAGLSGVAVSGSTVTVNSNGQLGVMASSRRFKRNIQPMGEESDVLLRLQPVSFQYKAEVDPSGAAQFGLVAEEVEKINPDLVACDEQGKPYTVRYEAVNAMLLNEFLKEHQRVQDQGATIARLQRQVEALTAGLQKVSAQLEMSKPAQQIVLNSH